MIKLLNNLSLSFQPKIDLKEKENEHHLDVLSKVTSLTVDLWKCFVFCEFWCFSWLYLHSIICIYCRYIAFSVFLLHNWWVPSIFTVKHTHADKFLVFWLHHSKVRVFLSELLLLVLCVYQLIPKHHSIAYLQNILNWKCVSAVNWYWPGGSRTEPVPEEYGMLTLRFLFTVEFCKKECVHHCNSNDSYGNT